VRWSSSLAPKEEALVAAESRSLSSMAEGDRAVMCRCRHGSCHLHLVSFTWGYGSSCVGMVPTAEGAAWRGHGGVGGKGKERRGRRRGQRYSGGSPAAEDSGSPPACREGGEGGLVGGRWRRGRKSERERGGRGRRRGKNGKWGRTHSEARADARRDRGRRTGSGRKY
jgi:hypothetical protein